MWNLHKNMMEALLLWVTWWDSQDIATLLWLCNTKLIPQVGQKYMLAAGKNVAICWDNFWDPEFLFIILKGTFYSSHVRKPDKTHLERCAPATTIKQRKLRGEVKKKRKKKPQEESSPQVHKGLVRIIRSPGGEGLSGVAWPARYTCLHG